MGIDRRLVVAAVAVAAAAIPAAAPAASPSAGSLVDPGGQVVWEGERLGRTPSVRPETCVLSQCDEFRLTVDLPARVWRRPGGVQIGVRWGVEGQDVDLYVYGPNGALAASSTGTIGFSAAQSVQLTTAANGTYRVVVVPVNVSDPDGLSYRGIAEVERPPRVRPLRELLPNLVALHPHHVRLATGAYYVPDGPGEAASCYPEEMAEQGARRCLRFDQGPGNRGDGPFELRYVMTRPGDPQLRQRIYRSDGSYRDHVADSWEFHPTHAHFHYKNFMSSRLWAADADGHRLSNTPVRTGRKNGFCLIDVDNIDFGSKGDAAKTYNFPRCNAPTDVDASGAHMTNGVSVGWADIYPWFLADQYIEISGLADGHYLLESLVDPNDTILETDETDNSATTLIRLSGNHAEIVD